MDVIRVLGVLGSHLSCNYMRKTERLLHEYSARVVESEMKYERLTYENDSINHTDESVVACRLLIASHRSTQCRSLQ